MIQIISSGIVKWLLKAGAISQDDKELYEYAAYSLLFSFIPLVLVMVISAILGMLPQGVTFIIPFLLLRKFSGGYHLESPGICFCVSIMVILIFLLAIKYMIWANAHLYCIPAVILAAVQLIAFSPIDSEARKLSQKELKAFRIIVRTITVVTVCVVAMTICTENQWISVCVSAGLVLTACLQWPCLPEKLLMKIMK